jgi:hypothetical protein
LQDAHLTVGTMPDEPKKVNGLGHRFIDDAEPSVDRRVIQA